MIIPKKFKEDWLNRPICRFIVYSVVIITSITYFQEYFKIAYDTTDSLPYRLYIIRKLDKKIIRGDVYAFTVSERSYKYYPEGITFMKRVTGLPGEKLQTDLIHRMITLQGEGLQKSFKVLDKDSAGKKITEILFFNGNIPENKYFFTGDAENSYDSRYWGLVDEKDIIGRAYPVF